MSGLKLEHVSHAFGNLTVITDVSLTVEDGEIVCLVGPSGCGKTTTLRIAAGLEEAQTGRVIIGDRLVADSSVSLPPEERGVGLVFQDYALFPHLSGLGNVTFGLKARAREDAQRRALDMLARVQMTGHAQSYPHTLSGGQQQRIALARALAPDPTLMLMDEPFSNLDVRLREEVCADTFTLLKETGTPTLLVTHDPRQAMRMADRIAVMRAGVIQQIAPPDDIYARPANAFTAKFFSEVNALEGTVRAGRVASPFGPIAANGLAEGAPVEVLIRPEALLVDGVGGAPEAPDVVEAHVLSARPLGSYRLVHLALASDRAVVLVAHMIGALAPKPGDTVAIRLDRDQTFVYPKTGGE